MKNGVNGYVVSDDTPKPVGATDEFDMRTLDFEEFMWEKGYYVSQRSRKIARVANPGQSGGRQWIIQTRSFCGPNS